MSKHFYNPKIFVLALAMGLFACDDDNEKPSLRTSIDYNTLTSETVYSQAFVDASGSSTVDLTEGNQRYKMFQALNYQSTSAISANTQIDATKLKNLFSNTGNPFVDISTSTISVTGAELNGSGVQLKNVVASSRSASEAEIVKARFETLFDEIATASASINNTASAGVAGKLGTSLLDAKGLDLAQVIQKSLYGALQLDYIGNVLIDEGLQADNSKVVGDKKYSQREHNWDEAYGLLTLNPIFLQGATNDNRNVYEFGIGAYVWEFNKENYAKIYPAFLKGRAAIVNNDQNELQAQAQLIRTQLEKSIALGALKYLNDWKIATSDANRAKAFAEGLGLIYSLRFATVTGADAQFSDNIINGLIGSANGFWDLDATKINTASQAIKTKFGL